MICRACSAMNPPSAAVCGRCGVSLRRCASCGDALDATTNFCRACGSPVEAAGDAGRTGGDESPAGDAVAIDHAQAGAAGDDRPAAQGIRRGLQSLTRATGILHRRRTPASARPLVGSLLIIGPRGMNRELPLTELRELVIGRESPADIVLADAGVSRQHARLAPRAGELYLIDLGSRNGTLVNGNRLQGQQSLKPGDQIVIGPYRLVARPLASGDTVVVSHRETRVPLIMVLAGALTVFSAAVVAAVVSAAMLRDPGSRPPGSPVAAVLTESQQITEAVQRVRPSVVRIRTRTSEGEGVGTGIVIEDGVVITNGHVVQGDQNPTVTLADGRELPGQVLGVDSRVDLAVIRIAAPGLPVAAWGDSESLPIGSRLIAIGYALGASAFSSGEPTVTSGIFSGRRDFLGQSYVQTDTPINHGNSGGPLINLRGEIVGVNVLVVGRTTELQAQGLNLAIPAAIARLSVPVLRDRPPSGPVTAATASTTVTYRNSRFNYSIDHPAGWQVQDQRPELVTLTGDGVVLTISTVELLRPISRTEFADAVVADAPRRVSDFTVQQRASRRLRGGLDVEILDVSWTEQGKRLVAIEAIASQGVRGFHLSGAAESTLFNRVSGKVIDALNSFDAR